MTPSLRSMPTIVAVWRPGYGWVMAMPGDREVIAVDRAEAVQIIAREAPGSAIRWHRDTAETEAELRELWGGR